MCVCVVCGPALGAAQNGVWDDGNSIAGNERTNEPQVHLSAGLRSKESNGR